MTQETTAQREDTMIYRAPAPDSDKAAIQDIWGEQLEVRTVDASEVSDLLAEGWVTHPMHIDGKAKPEEAAGFEPVKGDALEAAEKLAGQLTCERDALAAEVKALTDDRDVLKNAVADLTKANAGVVEELAAAKADNVKLAADLKAAEELADSESKAKDAAVAEVAELKAAPPAKLGVKKEGS